MAQILQFSPKPLAKIGFQKVRKRRRSRKLENQLDLFSVPEGKVLQFQRLPSSSFDEALRLDEQGDERASQVYLDAIEQGDSVADAYCNLGILQSSAGNTTKAFDCFTKSLKHESRHLESHYNLGNLYFEAGDYALAKTHFEIALELDPFFPNAYFNLGLVHAIKNDLGAATEAFKKYVELVPKKDGETVQNLLDSLSQSAQVKK